MNRVVALAITFAMVLGSIYVYQKVLKKDITLLGKS